MSNVFTVVYLKHVVLQFPNSIRNLAQGLVLKIPYLDHSVALKVPQFNCRFCALKLVQRLVKH